MEDILNLDRLGAVLMEDRADWQKYIFDRVGVWVKPEAEEHPYWELISSCGTADLDEDMDGEETCTINSAEDLAAYIERMESYEEKLKNINFGCFIKAELFWAIQARIMEVNLYEGDPAKRVYGFRSMEGTDSLYLDMSAREYDAISGITLDVTDNMTLDEAVDHVAKQLEQFYHAQPDWKGEVPAFRYDPEKEFVIPKTAEDMEKCCGLIQY